MDLSAALVFPAFLVFARLGAAVMVFPGLSDVAIPARIRLLVAVTASLVMFPLLQPQLPPLPPRTGDMALLLFGELAIGLCMGMGARLFMAALNLAGELISFAAGIQAATLFDPSSGSNSGAMSVLLTLLGGLLVLALGLHHDLIRAVAASYTAFPAGELPPVQGVMTAAVQVFAQMFALGLQLAAPVVIAGLLSNALFGVLNRLIPQLQVYFVSIPMSISLSVLVLVAALGPMMQLWSTQVTATMSLFQVEDTTP